MEAGGCARIIECNRSSSAHHRVCTFFQPFSTLLVKGLATPRLLEVLAERQSPDGNKRPRGTPTCLTPVRPKSEVVHQGEQFRSQKPDGHAHTKNAITLHACTTSSDLEVEKQEVR